MSIAGTSRFRYMEWLLGQLHAEQHAAAPSGDGAREFEFALDLILDGLERARG